MVITSELDLPTEEELTTTEINLTGAALHAGAFHLGKHCENPNNEFVLCREELNDPRKCINEGKEVTSCTLEFFRKVKKSCAEEFAQYANCLDKSSTKFEYTKCRKTQAVFDKCMLDNVGIERPEFGYFCRPKVHATSRPKPPIEGPAVYPDAADSLPNDYPRTAAKYGSRYPLD